jgi:para-aminobenzoate synthetase component 1
LRTIKKILIKNDPNFKSKLLAWAQQFEQIVWLDSNNYPQKYSKFQAVLAVEAQSILQSGFKNAFAKLKNYKNHLRDYIFGYLSYDLKNDIEVLRSDNFDGLQFPELYFFQPKRLFFLNDNEVEVQYLKEFEAEIEDDLSNILNMDMLSKKPNNSIVDYNIKHEVKIHKRVTKKAYLNNLHIIQEHIHRGDIYEVNYCQEFYAENACINPLEVYLHLNDISKPPFASLVKLNNLYLLSASPERFVTKEKNKIISQPIKGTAKRSTNKSTDKKLAQALSIDIKERAENIMIVDLVRNDLSKTAIRGTVTVEELCKVYTFDQVHQMVSTITSMIDDETESVDVIKSLFPMGSMTGAPKISAMKIIEKLETTKRSLYSGAVGYFTPSDDFDFNVVIRSILYNRSAKYLSYSVGGAITSESDPEKEYQECLLKAIAMKKALKN